MLTSYDFSEVVYMKEVLFAARTVIWLFAYGLASAVGLVKTILNYSELATSEALVKRTN